MCNTLSKKLEKKSENRQKVTIFTTITVILSLPPEW
jgi:hypothetical protein